MHFVHSIREVIRVDNATHANEFEDILDVQGNPITGEDREDLAAVDPAHRIGVRAGSLHAMSALRELVQSSQALLVLDLSICDLDACALYDFFWWTWQHAVQLIAGVLQLGCWLYRSSRGRPDRTS